MSRKDSETFFCLRVFFLLSCFFLFDFYHMFRSRFLIKRLPCFQIIRQHCLCFFIFRFYRTIFPPVDRTKFLRFFLLLRCQSISPSRSGITEHQRSLIRDIRSISAGR